MMASAGYALEDLRKQARHLENEIDLKLVSFSKLGTGFGSRELKNESLDTAPLLGRDHMFETMTLEIEQLLSKLGEVNDQMSQVQTSSGGAPQRHGSSHAAASPGHSAGLRARVPQDAHQRPGPPGEGLASRIRAQGH
ncbi:hypothetical protein MTO96_005868 [Rhipicephalus appendiculatus]